jgi:N-acetylneuraminate synthase
MSTAAIPDIVIGDRVVGLDHPCYVIAEAGSNHNGSLELARRLIDVAAEVGADAVKFQNFRADKLYPRTAGRSDYLGDKRSIYDIIRAIEMPPEWLPALAEHAQNQGIAFLSSAFDEASVDLVDPHVAAFKCASYEMTHTPLLRHMARRQKPVILSTGTATLGEVEEAVSTARASGNHDLVVLQCTAAYPAPLESINAMALCTIRDALGVLTGLSDHSRDPLVAPMTAVALGAVVIEKHFTLSNRLPGPDHAFAVEPHELAEMIRRIRDVELARGTGEKVVHPVEAELRGFARRSVFATRRIEPGERLTEQNSAVLRCGKLRHGLLPRDYPNALGREVCRPIAADAPITWDDLGTLVPRRGPRRPEKVESEPASIALRDAGPGDCRLVWQWKNEPDARRLAFIAKYIPWEEHRAWYARRLAETDPSLWIIEEGADPVGWIRIDRGGEVGVASIALGAEARGRGIGGRAIALACERFVRQGGPERVEALIKPENERSARAFRRAGFTPAGACEVRGQPALVFAWPGEPEPDAEAAPGEAALGEVAAPS